MAVINGNAAFSAARKKTNPMVKIPGNVKKMFNIAEADATGIFKIEPAKGMCLYDRCYIFEDINYINQDDNMKEQILLLLATWMNSMKFDYKTSMIGEYRDINDFLNEIFVSKHKEEYPVIMEGIGEWINEKAKEGQQNIREIMYLTVTCRANSYDDAKIFFDNLDANLHNMFQMWKSRLYRLSGIERLFCMYRFFHADEENHFNLNHTKLKQWDDSWKNDILPESIDCYSDFMIFDGERYVSVLFGKNFSESIDEGDFMHQFSTMPFPHVITCDWAPVEKQELKNKLAAAHMNNEKAISQEIDLKRNNGQLTSGVSYTRNKKKDELEEYRDQVSNNDEKAFFLGFLVIVMAPDEDTLASRVEHVKTIGDTVGVKMNTYDHRQLKALNTALPYGGRQVNCMRPLLTSSAVAFHNYYAQDLLQVGGNCYGLNRTTKHLVIGNRKRLDGPHGMIVGPTGKGKSFFIKTTEISQPLLITDDDVWVIDPQNEFKDTIENYNGQYFDFTPKSDTHLNPFEIPADIFSGSHIEKEMYVADQKDYAKSFCKATMIGYEPNALHYKIISRCIQLMYEESFSQRKLKKQPTWKNFYAILEQQMEDSTGEDRHMAKEIYDSLTEFVEGSYDMFAYESNIEVRSRLVGFGIKNVKEDLWEPVMLTILHSLDVQVNYNQRMHKAIRLIVDESQVVCRDKMSAERLNHAVITLRKYGGIVTMVFQNLSKIANDEDIKLMFSNCEFKVFFNLKDMDAITLRQIQDLSQNEFNSIGEGAIGYGLMVWGEKVIKFDAFMDHDNPLYSMFNTNFHEKAEQEKKELQHMDKKIEEKKDPFGEQKELILIAAELSPLSIQDAMAVLGESLEVTKQLLVDMADEGQLEIVDATGIIQYRKV